MIGIDYQKFLERFQARFAETATWLASQPVEVHRAWADAFRDVDAVAAIRVMDAIFRGDVEQPKYFSGWPALIRKLSFSGDFRQRAIDRPDYGAPKMVNGDWTFRCLDCRDTGSVICWHPKTMHALEKVFGTENENHFWEPGKKYTCAVRCSCEIGQDRFRWMEMIYDPKRWVLYDGNQEQDRERLVGFISSFRHRDPFDELPAEF